MSKKTIEVSEILELLKENYPHIEYLSTISEGVSNAVVLLVHIREKSEQSYTGNAFLKIDTTERCFREFELNKEARNDCNADHIPAVIDKPLPLNESLSMIQYEPAHLVTHSARSMGVIIREDSASITQLAEQISHLLNDVLICWHEPEKLLADSSPRKIPQLFHELINVGSKSRFEELIDRALLYDLPDTSSRILTFRPGTNIELPNPLAYILDSSVWKDVQQIITPNAPTHGDLHAGNIICNDLSENTSPWLIDFAHFDDYGLLFFDLAYLEFDLLTRYLPIKMQNDDSWHDWVRLTDHLSSEVLPSSDPHGRNTKSPWELVKPIRQYLKRILKSVESKPGISQDFEAAWWLCLTAVGTLFARRSRVARREQRIISLFYSARALKKLLDLTHVRLEYRNATEVWWREAPWSGSPFLGLKAYDLAESSIFFGRNREIDALVKMLADNTEERFSMVTGASGSGKSSLVAAGLIPRLERDAIANSRNWVVLRFTPDEDPFVSLRVALNDGLCPGERSLATRVRNDPFLLDELCVKYRGSDHQLLLFVDQFEELFTLCDDQKTVNAFIQLLSAVPRMQYVRVVATMRNDFYTNCFDYPDLLNLIQRRDYKLGAPGQPAIREMITRPAQRAGLEFEEGLIERILNDTGTDPGALALLSYTLEQLYNSRENDSRLTLNAYQLIGGVPGAIETQAQTTYDSLSKDAQNALASVFNNLVGVDPESGVAIRQRAPYSRFKSDAALELIHSFSDARLLVFDKGDEGEPIVEVAHEALLRSWPLLVEWISKAKDDIRLLRRVFNAAKEWVDNQRDENFLWKHELLEPVYELIERTGQELDDYVREFIRPESERELDKFKDISDRVISTDISMADAAIEQSAIINRFGEIGISALPQILSAQIYSSGSGVRRRLNQLIDSLRPQMAPELVKMLFDDKHQRTAERYIKTHGLPGGAGKYIRPYLSAEIDKNTLIYALNLVYEYRLEDVARDAVYVLDTAKDSNVLNLAQKIINSFGRGYLVFSENQPRKMEGLQTIHRQYNRKFLPILVELFAELNREAPKLLYSTLALFDDEDSIDTLLEIDDLELQNNLVSAIDRKNYHGFTARLIRLHGETSNEQLRLAIENVLLNFANSEAIQYILEAGTDANKLRVVDIIELVFDDPTETLISILNNDTSSDVLKDAIVERLKSDQTYISLIQVAQINDEKVRQMLQQRGTQERFATITPDEMRNLSDEDFALMIEEIDRIPFLGTLSRLEHDERIAVLQRLGDYPSNATVRLIVFTLQNMNLDAKTRTVVMLVLLKIGTIDALKTLLNLNVSASSLGQLVSSMPPEEQALISGHLRQLYNSDADKNIRQNAVNILITLGDPDILNNLFSHSLKLVQLQQLSRMAPFEYLMWLSMNSQDLMIVKSTHFVLLLHLIDETEMIELAYKLFFAESNDERQQIKASLKKIGSPTAMTILNEWNQVSLD